MVPVPPSVSMKTAASQDNREGGVRVTKEEHRNEIQEHGEIAI